MSPPASTNLKVNAETINGVTKEGALVAVGDSCTVYIVQDSTNIADTPKPLAPCPDQADSTTFEPVIYIGTWGNGAR